MRAHRERLELSQDRFADEIGMHRSYYGAIERGDRNLTLDTLLRVCEGLRCRPSRLLADAGL